MKNQHSLPLSMFFVVFLLGCSTTPEDGRTAGKRAGTLPNALATAEDFDQLLVNQKVPAFKAHTLDGVLVDSHYFRHKVTVITFMYLGCAPCQAEAPMLRKLYQKIQSAHFQMLCIAPQTPQQMKSLWPYMIPYPIVAECSLTNALGQPSGPDCGALSKQFQVGGYPVTLLIDGEGIIRHRHAGFSSEHPPALEAEVARLLEQLRH